MIHLVALPIHLPAIILAGGYKVSKTFEDLVSELSGNENTGGAEGRMDEIHLEMRAPTAPEPGWIRGYFLGEFFVEID